MLKEYGKYKFNLDKDCFINDNDERIFLKNNKNEFVATFIDKNGFVTLQLYDGNSDSLDKQIEKVVKYKEDENKDLYKAIEISKELKIKNETINPIGDGRTEEQMKTLSDYAEPPSLEEVSDTFNKQKPKLEELESKSLRNKISELEERVKILEDSVEDIQSWRNS